MGINQPISSAVNETRPCRALSDILVIATCGQDASFPSDHAVMATALPVAFSRIYVAAHYPHDVVAGLLLGAAVSVVGYLLVRGLLIRLIAALHGTPLRPLLTSAPRPAAATEPVPR